MTRKATKAPRQKREVPPDSLGFRLTLAMDMADVMNTELAAATGKTPVAVSNWRRNVDPPTQANVLKIIEFLRARGVVVSMDWLVKGIGAAPHPVSPDGDGSVPMPVADALAQIEVLIDRLGARRSDGPDREPEELAVDHAILETIKSNVRSAMIVAVENPAAREEIVGIFARIMTAHTVTPADEAPTKHMSNGHGKKRR